MNYYYIYDMTILYTADIDMNIDSSKNVNYY